FTSCVSFYSILGELNDYAGQREVVAEEMSHKVYHELMRYSQELKAERKHVSISKKKFERECREAEKAQITFDRLDNDINATKSEVEKAKAQLYMRTHMADESKNEYAAQLQNFNAEQWKHFNSAIPQIFKVPSLEDFSHLPPEQRRKRLQQKIDELNRELQKETDQRDALNKMKDVYEKNPQMGDPNSLQPKLSETNSLRAVTRMTPARSTTRLTTALRSRLNRSMTLMSLMMNLTMTTRYPSSGTAKRSTLSTVLYIIEEDKGDGWTRARKQSGKEGYVPTSYVEITIEKNSKGAVTYI
ncbi:hypothetical protein GOODEAATRI_002444, partial [Goodea atripinnis]